MNNPRSGTRSHLKNPPQPASPLSDRPRRSSQARQIAYTFRPPSVSTQQSPQTGL